MLSFRVYDLILLTTEYGGWTGKRLHCFMQESFFRSFVNFKIDEIDEIGCKIKKKLPDINGSTSICQCVYPRFLHSSKD
jgi:hypothetical protein